MHMQLGCWLWYFLLFCACQPGSIGVFAPAAYLYVIPDAGGCQVDARDVVSINLPVIAADWLCMQVLRTASQRAWIAPMARQKCHAVLLTGHGSGA